MFGVCVNNLVGLICEESPAGIERKAQVDLWEKDRFDKFKWEDESLPISTGGLSRVLTAFRRKFGQINRYDHVPVIWAKGTHIQNELGLSSGGYWGPLARAEKLGFLIRIDQHGASGNRKILICKMPNESEFHAIARAKGAVERYIAKKPSVPTWVLHALRVELNNRIAAASAVLTVGRCAPGDRFESLLCRDPVSDLQSPSLCKSEAPTYIEQEVNRNFTGGGSREPATSIEQTNESSPLLKSSDLRTSTRKDTTKTVDDLIKNILHDVHNSKNSPDFPQTLRLIATAVEEATQLELPHPEPLHHDASIEKSVETSAYNPTALQSAKASPTKKNTPTTHGNDGERPLEAFLSHLLGMYGLTVRKQTITLISTSYEASLGDTEATRRELRAKIVRLIEREFPASTIANYLLEDCPSPRVNTYDDSKGGWDDPAPAKNTNGWDADPIEETPEVEEVPEFEPIRERLRTSVSSHNYKSWFATLKCIEMADSIVLLTPDEFSMSWIEIHYSDVLADAIEGAMGENRAFKIVPKRMTLNEETPKSAAYERSAAWD